MKIKNKYTDLIKNIFLFFIASFLPRAITFFMVPLYTYCLTTQEYGTIDLIITTGQLILPFITLQVQDAMLRFSMERLCDPAEVFTVGFRISCLGIFFLSVFCFWCQITGILTIDFLFVVFFMFICFTNALRSIASYFCRGIDKVKVVTTANIVLTVTTVSFNLLFLLVFKWGIYGYILSMCIGNALSVLILYFEPQLYKYIKWKINNKKLVTSIIRFSIPMIFSALAWWINTSLDKYLLSFFYNASLVGMLAVAYKIPSILSLFGTAIANAYSISAIKEFDQNDTDGFLGKSYLTINICFVLLCSLLILTNVFVAKMLFLNEFFTAWVYVPPLLLSALFGQLSLMCEQYYISLKKTQIISVTAIIGVFLNLISNLFLIPRCGAYGAASATALSFFVVWIVRYCTLKRYLKLKHNFFAECVSYILLLAQVCIAYFGNKFIMYQVAIFICIVWIYKKRIFAILEAGIKIIVKDS